MKTKISFIDDAIFDRDRATVYLHCTSVQPDALPVFSSAAGRVRSI
jgi:hypothetical protein